MEILSASFLSALVSIVIIDLVLAGDNAIVIALAARKLPPHLQRRAVMWGAIGAVAVRSVMTLGVVWLLGIPGLRFAGGALLLWIAYKLLAPSENKHGNFAPASTFWDAMKTIVVADAVMGVDNVLAVAGAAHGSYLLVVLGLLISIPIVMWGSTIILRYTERFPFIMYVGAAVLVLTGVKMMFAEPRVAAALHDATALKSAVYLLATTGLLLAGYVANTGQRLRAAQRAHVALRRKHRLSSSEAAGTSRKILLPVDASGNALHALRALLRDQTASRRPEVVLLEAQSPHQAVVRSGHDAAAMLQNSQVKFERVAGAGPSAEVIADTARRHGCSSILLALAPKTSIARVCQNAVAAKLLEIAPVPVRLAVGTQRSRWDRFVLPLGIALLIAVAVVLYRAI